MSVASSSLNAAPSVRERRHAWIALALLVPAPSIGAFLAMLAFPEQAWAKAVFTLAKLWIVALPLAWLIFIERQRPCIPRPTRAGLTIGLVTGLAIFAAIAAAYSLLGHRIDEQSVREQAHAIGFTTLWIYLLGAAYWCTINAAIEEYVWRWFVFTRCERLVPRLAAVALAALFFTLHHIIVLGVYFDDVLLVVLSTLGVFAGGAIWSWIYLRYRDIWGAWLSHVLADIIIFVIGYQLIFGF